MGVYGWASAPANAEEAAAPAVVPPPVAAAAAPASADLLPTALPDPAPPAATPEPPAIAPAAAAVVPLVAEAPAPAPAAAPAPPPPVSPITRLPAYYNPPPYGPPGLNEPAVMAYMANQKNGTVAMLLEVLVPGAGSIYAHHAGGALFTWALTVGGGAMIVWGLEQARYFRPNANVSPIDRTDATSNIFAGVALLAVGRVYGLYDAYASSVDYNQALARHLGLPAGMVPSMAAIPTAAGSSIAYGPSMSMRF
jgi:hypothetical protein